MSSLALKGPYWVTVRQYRRTLRLTGALVILALATIGGLRIWDAQTPDTYMQGRYLVPSNENHGFGMLRWAMEYLSLGMVFLPLLVGAFVAGPLVARELESGTYKLSLTQSISPDRWLASKLLTTSVASVAATLALIAVHRIGWGRVSGLWQLHWSDRGSYEATGSVLVAYVLLAVAIGALLGQLIRRTLLAMAATGLVTGAVLLVLGSLRWSFLPVLTVTGPVGPEARHLNVPDNGLMMDMGMLFRDGGRTTEWLCWDPSQDQSACLAAKNITGQYVDYHPQSHFWPTQLIETGILLALTALVAFAAFRVLRTRHP
ncbi:MULTISPECIES: ABC transporter permease subunit [unclassified Streptomyces]|uniref:ABC transporter permease n=1 Tax=unclassified Streptomyces TaxID=2593676 RepID=UPI0006F93A63|nr:MULTISPECIES: ABC transporter permease subunit [unclassified Streptomyces]KQX59586.1 hypothetical protein ASD33_04820 [Streptomyces sp. Root1304]KRB00844.1 hypothetical protein ASE09_04825 [Streptomyces sp. Root66D1]